MKTLITLLFLTAFISHVSFTKAQNVHIPDTNFEALLLKHDSINLNGDDEIQVSEAERFNGSIDCANQKIRDLTGIEEFKSITALDCSYNLLTSLNVSENENLIILNCHENQLNSLNVIPNSTLVSLDVGYNNLESLDVSQNGDLEYLDCENNLLKDLDISQNILLKHLNSSQNNLSILDLSENLKLENLNCARNNSLGVLDVRRISGLKYFNCEGTALTEVDVTKNPELLELSCGGGVFNTSNHLTVLDVSENPLLEHLDCSDNSLTELDLSNNPLLRFLSCSYNKLKVLDVRHNPYLYTLYCQGNQLASLDVSQNLYLTNIHCFDNDLTELDVSPNLILEEIKCQRNQLQTLDFSKNPFLISLDCSDNLLTELNVANGNNPEFWIFEAGNNPDLKCIQVDDKEYSSENWTGIDPAVTQFSEDCMLSPETVYIPDPNFKGYLLGQPGINTNGDHHIQYSEAEAFDGTLDCSKQRIVDMTGLESFTNLRGVDCSDNKLRALDLSNNHALVDLDCRNNSLIELNIANGNNIHFNQFTATNNPGLTCIQVDDAEYSRSNWPGIDSSSDFSHDCQYGERVVHIPDPDFKRFLLGHQGINTNGDNEIQVKEAQDFDGRIDCSALGIKDMAGIEAFTGLRELDCSDNILTDLDLTYNFKLKFLNCSYNKMTRLNVSNNHLLWNLNCSANLLASLEVFRNKYLKELDCSSNQLTNIDVSTNPVMTDLYCSENRLINLNIANGNRYLRLYAPDNPNLYCIQVDDDDFSRTFWPSDVKDKQARYDEDCAPVINTGKIHTRSYSRNSISVYPNPAHDYVNINNLPANTRIQVIDLTGRLVKIVGTTSRSKRIDLSSVNSGLYIVRLTYNGGSDAFKVVVK